MKTTKNIIAKIALLTMVLGFSFNVKAQSNFDVMSMTAHQTSNVSSASSNVATKVVKIQTADMQSNVDKMTTSFAAKNVENGTVRLAVKTSSSVALLDEESLNVKVSFEARPVGGILSVQVSMAPSFRGVGISTRPTISRSAARAVDELNDTVIQELVRELTNEIDAEVALQSAREYSAKQ